MEQYLKDLVYKATAARFSDWGDNWKDCGHELLMEDVSNKRILYRVTYIDGHGYFFQVFKGNTLKVGCLFDENEVGMIPMIVELFSMVYAKRPSRIDPIRRLKSEETPYGTETKHNDLNGIRGDIITTHWQRLR